MAARPVSVNSQCCTLRHSLHHAPRRRFSITLNSQAPAAASSRSTIPPESPKFISIPRPVQPPPSYKHWIKGTLPVPRQIFRPNDPDKTTAPYLASLTPEPRSRTLQKTHPPQTKDFMSYKSRQSERRRQNIRESLIELRFRKDATERRMLASSSRTQAYNLAARDAPERDDERLTMPTIIPSEVPKKQVLLPDPQREERLATKAGNVVYQKEAQEEERKDMLHKLYVSSGKFVTTVEQLDKLITDVFDDEMAFANDNSKGANIWHLGLPDSTEQLLRTSGQGRRARSNKAVDGSVRDQLTDERTKQLGDELTGGKV
ncbi:uncharacterized protein KY384_001978 [Bacidia gigantensis]|uniref:uncharacterized protein n=1 Tax=Bacidia gigantensis TaxID=2732470 RepID=UPI001D03C258|nr:uncharacterized protein KY384_001978 [Bacidia gigantensis]KAG8533195.1 hypothetical protein KY384_001978 [Bacidia gigantensis]